MHALMLMRKWNLVQMISTMTRTEIMSWKNLSLLKMMLFLQFQTTHVMAHHKTRQIRFVIGEHLYKTVMLLDSCRYWRGKIKPRVAFWPNQADCGTTEKRMSQCFHQENHKRVDQVRICHRNIPPPNIISCGRGVCYECYSTAILLLRN